jgi:hypothetical protein
VPEDKPLWRQAFDTAERAVAPHLEQAVQTPAFAQALALAGHARAEARRWTERRTSALWHLVNLPAGSDVRRLREQVAALERQVRQLNAALEDPDGSRDGR